MAGWWAKRSLAYAGKASTPTFPFDSCRNPSPCPRCRTSSKSSSSGRSTRRLSALACSPATCWRNSTALALPASARPASTGCATAGSCTCSVARSREATPPPESRAIADRVRPGAHRTPGHPVLRATPLPAFDSGFHGPVAIIVRFSYNERPAASDMSDEHESFIETPKQLVWIIFLAFAVPIAIIVLLITYVGSTTTQAIGSDNMTPEAIEARIKPVAGFELGSGGPASAEPRSGEAVYTAQRAACHAAGVAGAPKMGDAGAWADRLKQGLEALVQAAVKGKGAMPPQGGTASEFEIARAVVH